MGKVLIVVDMLKGFVNEKTKDGPCALFVKGASELIPDIKKEMANMKKGDHIIFVCDNHAPDDKEFNKFPPHCIKGTEESQIVEFGGGYEAAMDKIPKTRFSGFFKTSLGVVMKGYNPDEVIVVGVCTEYCVLATVLDAVMNDYKVTVPANCVHGLTEDGHNAALKYMKDTLGVNVI